MLHCFRVDIKYSKKYLLTDKQIPNKKLNPEYGDV